MDVTALPFNRLVGLEPASPESGYLVSLPAGPQYTNHVGTVHAAALLAVAEAASGVFLARHLGHLEGFVPVVRRLEAKFRNPARGRVSAKAWVGADELGRTVSELVTRGRAFVTVAVDVEDEDGTRAMTAKVEWFITRAEGASED